MRKLGRMVRRVLTAVSLLLFVAVLAAWVRGYWSRDTCWAERESMDETGWRRTGWRVASGSGDVGVERYRLYADVARARAARKTPGILWKSDFVRSSPKRISPMYAWSAAEVNSTNGTGWHWDHWGVALGWASERGWSFDGVKDSYHEFSFLAFPCWMAAIVFGALPSWRGFVWWRGVRRRRLASREGRCPVCGYDLRASPQRCPECGMVVGEKEQVRCDPD